MLGPYGIGPVAARQLAAWQQVAAEWRLSLRDGHLACAACDTSVLSLVGPDGKPFWIYPDVILAGTVSHLRACHADVEPAGL